MKKLDQFISDFAAHEVLYAITQGHTYGTHRGILLVRGGMYIHGNSWHVPGSNFGDSYWLLTEYTPIEMREVATGWLRSADYVNFSLGSHFLTLHCAENGTS